MTTLELPTRPAPARVPDTACRLCGGATVARFSLRVLDRHQVAYLECGQCRSLQTERPWWLADAYGTPHGTQQPNLDTGAIQRNLRNFVAALTVARLFELGSAVDFGANDGMLCRFLRDHGLDARACDKYGGLAYARGFEAATGAHCDLLTAFEVLEHFAEPRRDLDELFAAAPRVLLLTTEIYTDQGPDWWYLAPQGGQHVFFYSPEAIVSIAAGRGYRATLAGAWILLVREDEPHAERRMAAAAEMLRGWVFEAIKAYTFLPPTPGVQADHQRLAAAMAAAGGAADR